MAAPPNGDELKDDSKISSDTKVLRRIPPEKIKPKTRIPSSDNFSNHYDGSGTSVTIWADGVTPDDVLKDHESFGLVALTVAEIRAQGLGIIRAPLPDNPNHAHLQGKKTTGKKRRLAAAAEWIREPRI